MGQDDPGLRAEELVDLYLVPGRHGSRGGSLRHDLRCRHPRLLHEWRREQGTRKSGLRALRREPGRKGADAQRLDLVARDVQLLQAEGCGLAVHAVGDVRRTRSVWRAQDGLRQSGPRLGLEGQRVP